MLVRRGEQVLILCQFHLRLGVSRAGALGEDVQDKVRPVQDLGLRQGLAQVAKLGRAELVIEDEQVDVVLFDVLRDFLKLPLAHKGSDVGVVQRLGERADGFRMGCSGQEFEFIEVFGQQLSGLVPGNETDQNRPLGLAVFSCKGLLQHYSRKRSMYWATALISARFRMSFWPGMVPLP